ncbi:MAG: hypothetical protein SFV32_07295 [Opitutaceae bacterium]|nr:hypothetical protein [Opitutaceae bacterium]
MPKETPLTIAPAHAETAQPVFKDRAELDEFWHEFYSKVKRQLQEWDTARAQSEENARNLWLRRQPPAE